jgi:hypothetical protein
MIFGRNEIQASKLPVSNPEFSIRKSKKAEALVVMERALYQLRIKN